MTIALLLLILITHFENSFFDIRAKKKFLWIKESFGEEMVVLPSILILKNMLVCDQWGSNIKKKTLHNVKIVATFVNSKKFSFIQRNRFVSLH